MREFWEQFRGAILNFGVGNAIEIILIAVLIYFCLVILKRNGVLRLAKLFFLIVLTALVLSWERFGLTLVRPVLIAVPFVAVLLIVVLFFNDFKRSILKLGSVKEDKVRFGVERGTDEDRKRAVREVVRAVLSMAKRDCGALIVLVSDTIQSHIIESGISLNAHLSGQLLESIFNPKGSLHDGAVVIKGDTILAAGCFLSLTQDITVDKELGTRHRAAIGVTETNNVISIVVSEETGVISVAKAGELKRYIDSDMLTAVMEEFYGLKADGKGRKRGKVRGVRK
ncbi:MAG: diadenylate cyclase [Firmicutes bacterium]|nr:diadenylate cyclase [Bacillota bacterium]